VLFQDVGNVLTPVQFRIGGARLCHGQQVVAAELYGSNLVMPPAEVVGKLIGVWNMMHKKLMKF
jgi:hypothetical protein